MSERAMSERTGHAAAEMEAEVLVERRSMREQADERAGPGDLLELCDGDLHHGRADALAVVVLVDDDIPERKGFAVADHANHSDDLGRIVAGIGGGDAENRGAESRPLRANHLPIEQNGTDAGHPPMRIEPTSTRMCGGSDCVAVAGRSYCSGARETKFIAVGIKHLVFAQAQGLLARSSMIGTPADLCFSKRALTSSTRQKC